MMTPSIRLWNCSVLISSLLYFLCACSMVDGETQDLLADYPLEDVLYAARQLQDSTGFNKRLDIHSFGFSRGRRTGDDDFGKRLNPNSFGISRGKKDFPSYDPNFLEKDFGSFYDEKRGPPNGFGGMRGKRTQSLFDAITSDDDLTFAKRQPPRGYVVVRGKRDPISGVDVFRGKKMAPSGFSGMRGRKRTPPAGFSGIRGRKRALWEDSDESVLGELVKRGPPDGFLGLRGKKWTRMVDEEDSSQDSDTYSTTSNEDLSHYMDQLQFIMQLRRAESTREPDIAANRQLDWSGTGSDE